MRDNSSIPFRNGEIVTIASAPPELLNGLPHADQEAIKSCIGKPGVFVGIDKYGYAEIEFDEERNASRTIFVDLQVVLPFNSK